MGGMPPASPINNKGIVALNRKKRGRHSQAEETISRTHFAITDTANLTRATWLRTSSQPRPPLIRHSCVPFPWLLSPCVLRCLLPMSLVSPLSFHVPTDVPSSFAVCYRCPPMSFLWSILSSAPHPYVPTVAPLPLACPSSVIPSIPHSPSSLVRSDSHVPR